MNLMEKYEIMSDIDSIPVANEHVMDELISNGRVLLNSGSDEVIYSLNESFGILLWRNTLDSKVAICSNFHTPIISYTEERLKEGMSDLHRHDYIEIAYVVKGEFSQLIGGKKNTFSQGSICIIDRNSEHAEYVKDQDNFVIFLEMKEDFFDEVFYSELDNSNVKQFIRKALMNQKSLKQFLQFTPLDGGDNIFLLIEQIANEKYENRKGAKYVIKGLMIRMFDILTKDYDMNLNATELKMMNDLIFSEVEDYLMKNYKDASLKELTKQFHFQQDYFSRLIKKHIGITFSELLRKIRISKAEELLQNTRMTVSSIIQSVGYENRHHFYNIFFEIHKMTPEQYRQKHEIQIKR